MLKELEKSNESVRISNILLATDFASRSEKAQQYTGLLARKLEARVFVLHAIEDLEIPERELDQQLLDWKRDLQAGLQSKLDGVVAWFVDRSVEAQGQLVWGKAWEVIFSAVRAGSIDLIVVGSHGVADRDNHLLLGTTSHKVALACPIPVLIVRADDSFQDPD